MAFYSFNHDLVATDLNGKWQKQRAFLYGDGHFTTARISDGKVEHLPFHLQRLKHANEILKFNAINWFRLEQTLLSLAKEYDSAILKVQISRGEASRGYGNTLLTQPYIFIWLTACPLSESNPVNLGVAVTPLSLNPTLAGIKHTNRLEQVLIAQELELKSLDDALVSDCEGYLIETNKANVFWFDGQNWHTPDLNRCGVAGVMRDVILKNNKDIILSRNKTSDVLSSAKSMVVCNSVIGLQVVASVEHQSYDLTLGQSFIEQVK